MEVTLHWHLLQFMLEQQEHFGGRDFETNTLAPSPVFWASWEVRHCDVLHLWFSPAILPPLNFSPLWACILHTFFFFYCCNFYFHELEKKKCNAWYTFSGFMQAVKCILKPVFSDLQLPSIFLLQRVVTNQKVFLIGSDSNMKDYWARNDRCIKFWEW